MELPQRHMKRHLLFADLLQAMLGEIDAFADADSGGPHEAESVALQGVGETELLLQLLIFLERKRFGEIVVGRRKIVTTNEVGRSKAPLVG
jgi:hypothetical protein